jgi:Gas vesicle protein G
VGLFKELALLPLAPVRGTAWIAEQLAEEAERELYDENRIKRELLQLELDEEEGTLSAAERENKEAELLERLQIAREREAAQAERLDAALEAAEMEDSEVIDRG